MPAIAADVKSIEGLFELGQFRPATVQREYQWTVLNCKALLSDLRRILDQADATGADAMGADAPADEPVSPFADDTFADASSTDVGADSLDPTVVPPSLADAEPRVQDYFLGTIVVRKASAAQPGEPDVIDVYDGLQRLTTLTILLSVLRDHAADSAVSDRLHTLIAFPGGYRLGLRLGNTILCEEIQTRGEASRVRRPRRKLTETDLRVRSATRYFHDQIRGWPQDQLVNFAERLLDHVSVGLIEVADERIARQIFISTNLHGVRLSRPDLFKGQLIEQAETPEVAAEITRRWAEIVAIADDPGARLAPVLQSETEAALHQGLSNGHPREARGLDGLLQAVDFIERRQPQGVDAITLLADRVAITHPGDAVLGWLETLAARAQAWRELHDRIETMTSRDEVDLGIWKLRFFWWPEWKPLALLWYSDFLVKRAASNGRLPPATTKAFQERFVALHARCAALVLAGYDTHTLSKIFGKAIQQEIGGRQSPLTHALSFDANQLAKMRQTLTVPLTDKSRRVSIVQWLEASYWGRNVPEYVGRATVEHVLPQRAGTGSTWATGPFPDEDERYDCAQSLGNLAALDHRRNEELSNAEYPVKRAAYLRADLPKFKTLDQIAQHETWTPELIRRREADLVEHVFALMNLPPAQR